MGQQKISLRPRVLTGLSSVPPTVAMFAWPVRR